MHKISDTPADPAIIFEHVTKRFKIKHARSLKQTVIGALKRQRNTEDFTAVDDLSFAIFPGESVALMGRNGSGKSTALKMLSGVLRPDEGEILIAGRVAGLLEVGAGFHPDLTGRENVYLNAAILGMSEEETDARFDEILEFSEIGDFIDTEVKRYSSGMHARLGFSVAVHTEHDVLLVDEVLSVGDAEFRAKCQKKMEELRAAGKTMIIVSHSAAQVRRLCQRGIVLERGKAVFDGPIAGALDQMRSPAEKAAAAKAQAAAAAKRKAAEAAKRKAAEAAVATQKAAAPTPPSTVPATAQTPPPRPTARDAIAELVSAADPLTGKFPSRSELRD